MKLIGKFFKFPKRRYSGATKWKSVVGLEVHAQISSKSKLFSRSSTEFASPVNTNVSLFDAAIPGTLPLLNKRCVEAGVKTALALNCRVNPVSYFDRKHYFYADLPAGYQITQQRAPLANDGLLTFYVSTPGVNKKPYLSKARIKQLQLEQDSGRSLHDTNRTLIDLNRAGIPLMELVFEPDLTDGEEAASLINELVIILKRIQTCSCKMEEGALRVDANVSIHRPGEPLGVRAEVKNIGSIRGVAGAVKYEIKRQIKILEDGGRIINETRAWDANSKTTVPMRDKEEQQDYRYMPEPNLPPLRIAMGPIKFGCVNADDLKKQIPELPEETRSRLKENYGLTHEQTVTLVTEAKLQYLFENVLALGMVDAKLLANIIINDYLADVYKQGVSLDEVTIIPEHLKDIITMLMDETINRNIARILVHRIILGSNNSPTEMVKMENLSQINDKMEVEKICQDILDENPKMVKQYKSGKVKVFKAMLGAIANKTNERANMAMASNILKELLIKMK